MSDRWTITEAAALIAKPTKSLQRAVERAPIKLKKIRRGRKQVYIFEMRDLVFFCALDDLKADLTKVKQAELFNALKMVPEISTVEVGHLRYDFGPYVNILHKNIEAARQHDDLIDTDGLEPVLKGTKINAYRLAALCEGMKIREILQDYPALSEVQIKAAKAFADSHPKSGRPYPKITAKRALSETRADAGEFLPARR